MAKILNFRVIIEQDEDGTFVASAPGIPGCHSQGDSYEEAIKNIKQAIELCLEEAQVNKSYHARIDWNEAEGEKSRFLGVTQIPVPFNFST
jgi:predicted RNase H-like HicB family nuclease